MLQKIRFGTVRRERIGFPPAYGRCVCVRAVAGVLRSFGFLFSFSLSFQIFLRLPCRSSVVSQLWSEDATFWRISEVTGSFLRVLVVFLRAMEASLAPSTLVLRGGVEAFFSFTDVTLGSGKGRLL